MISSLLRLMYTDEQEKLASLRQILLCCRFPSVLRLRCETTGDPTPVPGVLQMVVTAMDFADAWVDLTVCAYKDEKSL